jgi:hypothetical protein
MFENRVLKRILAPRKDKEMGRSCKLQNDELHKLYSSTNITRMSKPRRMK